jgi:hypothetical protein
VILTLPIGPSGISVLTASSRTEAAVEGVFTGLVCDALFGGAVDILGKVTAASVYSYLGQTLGAFDQRPHFKANLTQLVSLRQSASAVARSTLRQLTVIFTSADFMLGLSPAYEPTAEPKDEANEKIFADLQKYRAARLLVPIGEEHLYFAAINSKACQLTPRRQSSLRAGSAFVVAQTHHTGTVLLGTDPTRKDMIVGISGHQELGSRVTIAWARAAISHELKRHPKGKGSPV